MKPEDFFCGFKIRTPFLGSEQPLDYSVKSFFINKILVHPKKSGKKIRKNPKKSEKICKNPRIFLRFKILTPYLGVNNPRKQV